MPWFLKILLTLAVIWSGVFTSSSAIWEAKRKNIFGAAVLLGIVLIMAVTFVCYMREDMMRLI